MSIWSTFTNNMMESLAQKIAPYINDALGRDMTVLSNYYEGNQRKQLKTKPGAQDDNIVQNFVGLAVDRSVSRLFRGGVKFIVPNGKTEQQEYLDRLWDLNKKPILLYQLGLHGSILRTAFVKIRPDALIEPYTGKLYPALIPTFPEIIRIKVDPQDMDVVLEYIIQYKTIEENEAGVTKDIAHREITKRNDNTWVVEEWEQSPTYGNQWVLISTTPWDYDFPPIIHWKNLPSLNSPLGDSDIDNAITIQDKNNFVVSNTGKIIKHHASQRPVGTGFSGNDMKPLDDSPDSMIVIPNPEAKVYLLNGQSDLASSREFANDLRQSIFDISREVDISSMADKLGQLTNFGLQVLWSDAIDKNDTKRQLYGDAFIELNRRLLVLNGWTGEDSNPGQVQWGNAMPVNLSEEISFDKQALDLGIIDKETVAKRYEMRYGVDWDTIQKNIKKYQEEQNQNNDNVGAEILRQFGRGGTVPMNQFRNVNERNNNPSQSAEAPTRTA